MWAHFVGECGESHDKFWELGWFEWSLYARRHRIHVRELKAVDDNHWARFRIQWADFRNANSSKGKRVKHTDLIRLPVDDKIQQEKATNVPDLEAVKRRFGAKVKKGKKGNGK